MRLKSFVIILKKATIWRLKNPCLRNIKDSQSANKATKDLETTLKTAQDSQSTLSNANPYALLYPRVDTSATLYASPQYDTVESAKDVQRVDTSAFSKP